MSPTFAYGRQKQIYRYYMPVSWQTGRKGNRGDGVQGRISADALEEFLVATLQRFSGRTTIAVADLATLLKRVELRSTETHILLDREASFPRDHPDLVLASVRRRIAADETAVLDCGDTSIRVVLPHPLQLRGGRVSVQGAEQEEPRRINRAVVNALRRAHGDLLALKASPLMAPKDLVDAATPETAHERQIARLALMSPALQRRIMEGDHPTGLSLRQLLKCPMPLAWADQVNLLEDLGRSEAYRVRP